MAKRAVGTYTLTVAREGAIALNRKGREAILQAFPPGTPAMADDRRVRVDPKDADTVFENFQKAKKVRPLNYGHGKDPAKGGEGGREAGRVHPHA